MLPVLCVWVPNGAQPGCVSITGQPAWDRLDVMGGQPAGPCRASLLAVNLEPHLHLHTEV